MRRGRIRRPLRTPPVTIKPKTVLASSRNFRISMSGSMQPGQEQQRTHSPSLLASGARRLGAGLGACTLLLCEMGLCAH